MEQASKLQTAAIDLISKYFGQSTAEIYTHFFSGEPDDVIITSLNEIMADYVGEEKAKTEIDKIVGEVAV